MERAAIVMPEGFLFRTSGGERNYKEQLIRLGWIDAVVSLPRGTLASANINASLLVIDKKRPPERDVYFYDASAELQSAVAYPVKRGAERVRHVVDSVRHHKSAPQGVQVRAAEIVANDFNLSVDRYVRSKHEQAIDEVLSEAATVELGDIAEIVRPQVIPTDDTEPLETFSEVGLADIAADGSIRSPSKKVPIGAKGLAQAKRHRLQPGDVLLSVKGRIGAVALVPEIHDQESDGWVASQAFVVVRLRPTSPIKLPLILYRYFASPLIQGLLNSLASGTTVPAVQMADVRRLRVIVPTKEQQRSIVAEHEKVQKLRAQIAGLQKLADELNQAAWPMSTTTVRPTDER